MRRMRANRPDILFLCTPNNPLGEGTKAQEIYDFIASCSKDTLIVVDGAYQEYAKYKDPAMSIDPHYLIEQFDNVVYTGTFSKAYGLGGMRVGYGIGCEKIIALLHKFRPPFNITSLSLKASAVALKDQSFVEHSIASNFEEMERYEKFCQSQSLEYIDSYTNFITIFLGR